MPLKTHLGLIESGSGGKEKPRLAGRYSPGLSPIYPQNRPPEDISAQSCYFFESCKKRPILPFRNPKTRFGDVDQRNLLLHPYMQTVLPIAGFDASSGAGITADLMVFAAHGLFGTSCITALTVQSTLGVRSTHPISAEILRATLNYLY